MYRHRISNNLSVGSYSESSGLPRIRQSIAEFISRRDAGVSSYTKDVFISAGSQRAIMVKYSAIMAVSSLCIVQITII